MDQGPYSSLTADRHSPDEGLEFLILGPLEVVEDGQPLAGLGHNPPPSSHRSPPKPLTATRIPC